MRPSAFDLIFPLTLSQQSLFDHYPDVYLGQHVYLQTYVAIKILQTKVAGDELEVFLQEARTIAHLVHPHIVRVMDFGVEREIPFLVMDYAPNGTLRQRHPRGKPLPLATIVPYVKQVADALQFAHNEKFIHRDVKPENMLLGRHNEVLLSDFGIALIAQSSRYQHTRDVAGTATYMAPEQIQGKPRPASDQYALAVVIYEWLSGDRPFLGSFTEVCAQHVFAPPPSLREKMPTLSSAVEEVVLTALAKKPSERFKSVQAFANALEQASRLDQPTSLATQLSTPPVLATPVEQPIEKPPLPPQIQGVEAPPSSPSLEPASDSTPAPIPLAGISGSTGGKRSLSETSRHTDEGHSPAEIAPAAQVSEERADTSGSLPEKASAWKVWGISQRKLLALVLGVLLYGTLAYSIDFLYSQDSSLVSTSLSVFNEDIDMGIVFVGLALIIPLFLGSVFGPWIGLVTILVGSYLGDHFASYSAASDYYGASWIWFVGHPLIGLITGLAVLRTQGRYNTGRAIVTAVAMSAVAIVIGTAFTTFGEIWVSGITVDAAWSEFLKLALPSTIDLIVLPLLLLTYTKAAQSVRGVQFNKRT